MADVPTGTIAPSGRASGGDGIGPDGSGREGFRTRVADWLGPHLDWITIPSWFLSLLLHGGVFAVLLIVAKLPGCQGDLSGADGGQVREVGITMKPAAQFASDNENPIEDALPDEAPADPIATLDSAPPESIPNSPPVALATPGSAINNVIGLGGPPRTEGGVGEMNLPSRLGAATPPPAGGGGGLRETSMFGIRDAGKRIVYVIDSSSSMSNYGAIRVAKGELLASLQPLDEKQQFQVVFSNSGATTPLKPPRFDMFFGTDIARDDVKRQLDNFGTAAGTNDFLAIQSALKFNPDVIFYLTDAGEPPLVAADYEDIKRLNRGGARIHTIHFGEQAQIVDGTGRPVSNFLIKLSEQNDGKYTYRDVTRFGR